MSRTPTPSIPLPLITDDGGDKALRSDSPARSDTPAGPDTPVRTATPMSRGTPIRSGTPIAGHPPVGSGTPVRQGSVKDGDLATPMELNAFMSELGVVMQLPRKKTTAAMPAIPEPVPVVSTRRRGMVLPVLALLLGIVALLSRVDTTVAARDIPVELRGEWTTDHPNYRERRLSFTERSVGIALRGGQTPRLHPVLSVSSEQRVDTMLVTIRYDDDGTPQDFRVVMLRGATRQVELSNPPGVVWVPARDAAATPSPAK